MKNRMVLLNGVCAGVLLALFFFSSGWAATLYVHPTVGTYPEINLAINAAAVGDEIVVAPGNYQPVTFNKQQIHVRSEKGPKVTKIIASVTDGVSFSQLSTGSSISGFHIIGGNSGIVINCPASGQTCSSITISNNIIEGARNHGIFLNSIATVNGSNATVSYIKISNNTIVGNTLSGIYLYSKGVCGGYQCTPRGGNIENITVENNIIMNNLQYGINRIVGGGSAFTSNVFYNNAFSNNPLADANAVTVLETDGNILNQPLLLMDPAGVDFMLALNSPAIDAGRAGSPYLDPDGTRNNIGVYGGPGAALFWPYPKGGPIVTALSVTPSSVPQGGTITIRATGTIR